MRLRGSTIGALNLFHLTAVELTPADVAAAQALADVATIAILQHRAIREAQLVNEQLVHVLNGRIMVEQAKGIVGERTGATMDEASVLLCDYARVKRQQLVDVAQSVIEGTLAVSDVRNAATTET
jgi:AmiR/NasT family two-component response regulator